jgi:exodeoxyribonuclease V beta subunit
MFNALLQNWGIRNRLLARPDGERRLTNLLHLGELLATAARNCPVLPGPLLRWFEQQVAGDTDAEVEDSSKMRLESDEHAVQVLTMHSSKGLEWEVVYCPFTWASGTSRQYKLSKAVLPPEARGQRPALRVDALGKSPSATAVLSRISPRIRREAAAEQTRLLYVAATRAKRLCHLAWGAIKDAESSGTAWLFHGLPVNPENWEQAERQLKQLQTPELVETAVGEARAAGPAQIHVRDWPEPSGTSWTLPATEARTLNARSYTRALDMGWGVHSFSSLSAGAEHAERDNDNVPGPAWIEAADGESIHAFPAGANAGTCLHSIFENIEFTAPSEIEAEVSRRLLIAGFDAERWTGVVSATLRAVLQAPLGEGFSLDRIPVQQRKVESEFLLPMSEFSSRDLQAALGEDAAGRLHFDSRQGWLKGFMDLVFEHAGRFYIVDWKSNRLGAQAGAYDTEGMHAAMVQHSYLLQASLYALALHRYLSARIPDYSYEAHFGGAFYVFVRGVAPESPGTGVYHAHPTEAEILALESLFQSAPHAC